MNVLTESEFEYLYQAVLEWPLTNWCSSPDEIWIELVKKDLADIEICTDPDKHKALYALIPTELGRSVLAKIAPLRKLAFCLKNHFRFNAQILVDELSREELPVALASDDKWIYEEALSRLRKLDLSFLQGSSQGGNSPGKGG